MTDPVATVIIPTFNHEKTLEVAVRCALGQTVAVEIFIIGDGVSDRKRESIETMLTWDDRIRFFDHPKHPSRGEPYRHEALQEARGRIIAYLCDRDIWFPGHVEYLAGLLDEADFAHSLPMLVFPEEDVRFAATDLQIPIHRHNMIHLGNRVPLSAAAHSRAFYATLERGWEETPRDQQTDWYFFKKFLQRKDCRCVSGPSPTAITFPSRPRPGWSDDERLAEVERWLARIGRENDRQTLTIMLLEKALQARDKALGEAYLQLFQQHRKAGKTAGSAG